MGPRARVGLWAGAALGSVVLVLTGVVGVSLVVGLSALSVVSSGLPDPSALSHLRFNQPTIVYDREGKVELGRFEQERRRVVAYAEVPQLILDATTTAEDRTFWSNPGIDPAAILSAAADHFTGLSDRGGSTITQQLVRSRLLPEEAVGPGSDRYMRKAKEIIQALRLNETFPGTEGKERIITAYLNEIFYGHDAYGIAAAAQIYFGVTDLAKLTIAQAALLAALPKSPSSLDPYLYAEEEKDGRLVVRRGSPPVVRRDWVLRGLSAGSRWTKVTPAMIEAALEEPVVLSGVPPVRVRGGHFTWQVRRALREMFGPEVDLETAGFRVITTLDWKAQTLAEKWLSASVIAPNVSRRTGERMLTKLKIPRGDLGWIRALRGKDLHNASLVALDYQTGDVLAYLGSAGYTRDDLRSRKFDPKYDAAGDGARQPGSAWKPVLYAAAFDAKRLTPGSVLLDVTTQFDRGQDWAPRDADQRERGPVLVRRALQYSLNIPAIRALERVGSKQVAKTAEAMGIRFAGGTKAFMQAGLAGALGTVEVRPLDLASAYGTIANGGVRVPPRMVLEVRSADGQIVWKAPDPDGERAISAQSAFLVSDILAGNTDPRQNHIWAEKLAIRNGPGGSRRPAAAKTGTTNDARDLGTYGFLPPSGEDGVGLAVGIWMGNSDHSYPSSRDPATSLTAAAPLWRAFVRDYTKGWPVAKFRRPKDVVAATIDAWSGGRPGPWTRDRTKEWFIRGTQPGASKAIDKDGLLYRQGCGGWRVDPVKAELGPSAWRGDVQDWLRRAHRGAGVTGRYDSATAYFWKESSWGGPLFGSCQRPKPPPDKKNKHDDKPKKDEGGPRNGGDGGGAPAPTPAPPAGG